MKEIENENQFNIPTEVPVEVNGFEHTPVINEDASTA